MRQFNAEKCKNQDIYVRSYVFEMTSKNKKYSIKCFGTQGVLVTSNPGRQDFERLCVNDVLIPGS